jgi:hypothetical protein
MKTNSIDLNKARKLSKVAAKQQNESWLEKVDREAKRFEDMQKHPHPRIIGTDVPGLEDQSCLFYFRGKYYHVKGQLKKIAEADVEQTLNDNADTKVYFMCENKSICPMPDALQNVEKEAVKVADETEAASFMTTKSGVTITKNDL